MDRHCDKPFEKKFKKIFGKPLDNSPLLWYNIYTVKERKVHSMAKTKKQLHEELRNKYLTMIAELLANAEEEVLSTGSNEIALPTLDSEGNDEYVVITVKVPTGSRDGDAYDGYAMAEEYRIKVANAKEREEKAKAEKERKIARDKAMREQKAKAKAEREAKGEG